MLDRFAERTLTRWLHKPRRKPLVVRGARQVGKSTLIRQFATRQKLRLFEVNLERHFSLAKVMETLDPRKILREIEFLADQGKVKAEDSLLFLDEIQGAPKALHCLRYFYEEMPELAVVSAGSLLEFSLADHSFPMPVGRVEYFHLGPMSWEEYLAARGEEALLRLLRETDWDEPFPQSAHERLLGLLRQFFLVGGMPEAVQTFVEGDDLSAAFEVQNAIVETYRDDFSKYATGSDLARLQRIMDYLGRHVCERVKYAHIDRDCQARELRKSLDLLLKAGIVFRAVHSHGDGLPLRAQANEKVFKLYNLDLSFFNRATGLNHLREEEMLDRRFVNEGKLAEQFIAQQLYFSDTPQRAPELHYWLREERAGNAEVDFLEAAGGAVLPMEVKSGKGGALKSLIQFAALKNCQLACRLDLNPPSRQRLHHRLGAKEVVFDLISLPLYLCGQIKRLAESHR
jgi:uncharacterized protein